MTIKEFLRNELFNRGLFENQCDEILEMAKNDPVFNGTMDNRWDDKIEGYPPMMRNVLLISLNPVVIKYIDEKCPEAWFRPLFM